MLCASIQTKLTSFMFEIPQMLPSLMQVQFKVQCLQLQAWKKKGWLIPQLSKVRVEVLHPSLEKMLTARNLHQPSWRESQSLDREQPNQRLNVNNVARHLDHPVLLQNTNLPTVMRENMFVQHVGRDSNVRTICKCILFATCVVSLLQCSLSTKLKLEQEFKSLVATWQH